MAKPTRKRTVEERLQLFDQHVTELLTESGGQVGWGVHVDLVPAQRVTVTEPGRESLRSFLMAVRIMDTPNEPDLFLPHVMDDVEAFPVTESTRELIGILRREHADAQASAGFQVSVPNGPITPRDAFELVAYSEHLHRNPDYEARAKALPPIVWELVRQMAHGYAVNLTDTAVLLRSVARDDPATSYLFQPAPPGTPTAAEIAAREGLRLPTEMA